MVIQRFSKWRLSAILNFENLQFLSLAVVGMPASCCKISLKSDNRLMSYDLKAIFKMEAAILNFKNFNFWSRDCNRVQYLL